MPIETARGTRRRFLLVRNPSAGVRGRRLVGRVIAELARRGAAVKSIATPDIVAARAAVAAEADVDAVIAAGGDGTVRVLAVALGGRRPLGIVPVGTGNVMAHEIGLPLDAAALADVLVTGPVVRVDGGLANGVPFFLMAGAGFDGAVVHNLNAGLKRHIGRAAYGMPILRELLVRSSRLHVTVDGKEHEAGWVVVARARRFGGSFLMAPEAGLLRPGLTAVLFKAPNRLARLRQLAALAMGRLEHRPDVEMHRCTRALIRSTEAKPAPAQIDGDAFATTPLEVTAAGPGLTLIVPPAYAPRP